MIDDKGTKNDKGKPRWSLLPTGTIDVVVAVLEFGATRYQVDNWQHVLDHRRRYYDATMRHLDAWWGGEKVDPDSGLPHLGHAVAGLLFLMWFDEQRVSPFMKSEDYTKEATLKGDTKDQNWMAR